MSRSEHIRTNLLDQRLCAKELYEFQSKTAESLSSLNLTRKLLGCGGERENKESLKGDLSVWG